MRLRCTAVAALPALNDALCIYKKLHFQHTNGVFKQRFIITKPKNPLNPADLLALAVDPVAEGAVQHSHTLLQSGQKCSHTVPQSRGMF